MNPSSTTTTGGGYYSNGDPHAIIAPTQPTGPGGIKLLRPRAGSASLRAAGGGVAGQTRTLGTGSSTGMNSSGGGGESGNVGRPSFPRSGTVVNYNNTSSSIPTTSRPSISLPEQTASTPTVDSTSSPPPLLRARSKSILVGGGSGVPEFAGKSLLAALQRIRATATANASRATSPDGGEPRERAERERSMSIVAPIGASSSAALSSSDVNKLRKQTYELTHSGPVGKINAKKLWRSGMLRLFSLRNAFTKDEKDDGEAASHHSGSDQQSELKKKSAAARRLLHSSSTAAARDEGPTASWESMMLEFRGLNASHHTRFEGRSQAITLRESTEEENRWFYTGEVGSGMYTYLHLPLTKSKKVLINQLRFQIQPLNASADDLELYVCVTNKLPDRNKYSWKLGRLQKMLIISKRDPKFAYGNGHFYLGVYGIGKNVTMMNFALKIQASEDTFVPYNQMLLQAGPGQPAEMNRETTAKNRLANKLNTLKHNRGAFEHFQRKVQEIIEERIAAAQQAESVAKEQAISPRARKTQKKQINYIASNKIHTEIGIHSSRELKRVLYVSTLEKKSTELHKTSDKKTDASGHHHHPPHDHQPVRDVDGEMLPREGDFADDVDEPDLTREHSDDGNEELDNMSGGASIGDDNLDVLNPVDEDHDDEDEEGGTPIAAQAQQHLDDLVKEVSAALDSQDAQQAQTTPGHQTNKSLEARRPSAIRTSTSPAHSTSHPRSASFSIPVSANMSPYTGTGTGTGRRTGRKMGASTSIGFQVPLTPVNLQIHDLLTARDEEEEAAAARYAVDDLGMSRLVDHHPSGGLSRQHSLQQQAAEKLRRLSKEHTRNESALSAMYSLKDEAAAPSISVTIPDDESTIGLASVSELEPLNRLDPVLETTQIETPSDGHPSAPISPMAVVNNNNHIDSKASQPASPHLSSFPHPLLPPLDLRSLDTGSLIDLASPTGDEIYPAGSASDSQSVSADASASASGRGSVVKHHRNHSRATSYYTEVSTANSGSSADTHAALLRTVAQHAAQGGQIHAVGAARKWIRMPFASPKNILRRRQGILAVGSSPTSPTNAQSADSSPNSPTAANNGASTERVQTAASQTARDSKQPVRGSLSSRRPAGPVKPTPEELAAKSALLRQTVENNLKLTQVALNRKRMAGPGAIVGESESKGETVKPKISPALSVMIEAHGVMASNQYDTTQAMHRQMTIRKNNPAKWMGRNFAVRNMKHAPDSTAPTRTNVDNETPYLSSTSKTHRIKLELAYLHRTSKPKKEKHPTPATTTTTTALPTPTAATTGNSTNLPTPSSVVTATTVTTEDESKEMAPSSLQSPAGTSSLPSPMSIAASSDEPLSPCKPLIQPVSPAAIRARAAHYRTGSLPLSMLMHSPVNIETLKSPISSLTSVAEAQPTDNDKKPTPLESLLSINSQLVQLATGLTPVLEIQDAGRSLSRSSQLSNDSSTTTESTQITTANLLHQPLSTVAEVDPTPTRPTVARTPTTLNRPGSAPNRPSSTAATSNAPIAVTSVAVPPAAPTPPSPASSALSPRPAPLQRAGTMSLIRDAGHTSLKGGGGAGAVRVMVAPFLSGADGAAQNGETDLIKVFKSDPYWQANFFHPTTIDPVTKQSVSTPLVLPADHLSQICLCLDFATRQRALLEKTANTLEDGIIARLVQQHTLILDKDATLLSLPTLPPDHPIRDHPYFLSHSLPSVVRWSPLDAKEHAALTHTRTQLKRFDGDLLELRQRFEKENEKLERIQKEEMEKRIQAKQAALLLASSSNASLQSNGSQSDRRPIKKTKPITAAEKKKRQERLGMNKTSSSQFLLPVNPNSELAHQLLTPSASITTFDVSTNVAGEVAVELTAVPASPKSKPASIPSSHMNSAAILSPRPSQPSLQNSPGHSPSLGPMSSARRITSFDDLDIDATAMSHLQPKTLHEWQAKSSTTPSSQTPTAAAESKTADEPALLKERPPSSATGAAPQSARADEHTYRPSRPSTRESNSRAGSSASNPIGRRSSLARHAPPPSAADQLYGGVPPPLTRGASSRRPSFISPKTRRLIDQRVNQDFDDDDDDAPVPPASFKNIHHEFKEETRFLRRKSIEDLRTTATNVKKPVAPPAPVANLATTFVRLTRALSNASLAAPSSSMQSSAASLHTSASAGAATTGVLPASLASKLVRQTRLAKRKQLFGTIAHEMKLEREEELRRASAHSHHKVVCVRGMSQAFNSQLTPILNVSEGTEGLSRALNHRDISGGGGPVLLNHDNIYGGVTNTSYDARHLSHRYADHLQQSKQRRHLRDDSNGSMDFSVTGGLKGISSQVSLVDSEAAFKSHRMIYAKLNYLKLEHVEPAKRMEAEIEQERFK